MGKASFKVPGGKMLVAETEADGGRLAMVKITGDFFMHPEEAIDELESSLAGCKADASTIGEALAKFFGDRQIELVGASPGDMARVIVMSLGG